VGSLFSVLSPSASPSSYSTAFTPGVASDLNTPQTPQTLNYFAGKQNILNLYFVKIGWFWTTLAFLLLQFTSLNPFLQRQQQQQRSTPSNNRVLQAIVRYSLMTLTWILTTQWFFGPALIDRSFTSTGGRCVPQHSQAFYSSSSTSSSSPAAASSLGARAIHLSSVATNVSCKAKGGQWLGGHDISGHFFMLVLSSACLFLEFFISESQVQAAEDARGEKTSEEQEETEAVVKARLWAHYLVWTVIVLDGWMLLMTAIWFHTLFEKLSGLTLAALSVWAVYFLPRFWPAWRGVVGGV
jgi:Inositol phospholipid synthesis and fat-storage-inducing TM